MTCPALRAPFRGPFVTHTPNDGGMTMNSLLRSRRATTPVVVAVILALFAFGPKPHITAADCPAGFRIAGSEEHKSAETADSKDAGKVDAPQVCLNDVHPESLEDLEGLAAQRGAIRTA